MWGFSYIIILLWEHNPLISSTEDCVGCFYTSPDDMRYPFTLQVTGHTVSHVQAVKLVHTSNLCLRNSFIHKLYYIIKSHINWPTSQYVLPLTICFVDCWKFQVIELLKWHCLYCIKNLLWPSHHCCMVGFTSHGFIAQVL